jgi:norsolorinic acid ketoreductase
LLSAYLSRPDHVVIASLRDPTSTSSKGLHDLPHGKDSKVILIKIDSANESDALETVKVLQSEYKITKLDVVIANAGISNYFGKAAVTPVEEMLSHFKINTVASLLLFHAAVPLLNAATNPKFIAISSGAASISNMGNLPVANSAYGSSKAAANFVTRKIHFENPNLIAFPVQPGWLRTDVSTTDFQPRERRLTASLSWAVMLLLVRG